MNDKIQQLSDRLRRIDSLLQPIRERLDLDWGAWNEEHKGEGGGGSGRSSGASGGGSARPNYDQAIADGTVSNMYADRGVHVPVNNAQADLEVALRSTNDAMLKKGKTSEVDTVKVAQGMQKLGARAGLLASRLQKANAPLAAKFKAVSKELKAAPKPTTGTFDEVLRDVSPLVDKVTTHLDEMKLYRAACSKASR